ncbi:hypothetical protein [Plantactinospora endophytica]|uniref:Uncharacterized protein n=1 Tax=Plantactinospora endophytica TaxID=673535 RepID=A0ABQ4E395_9ACTN|nr:hypothetical protein [Plantactinospora endophytica]GIG89157.1 hypothetical protein Pen02_40930 [Plantactinospora endophytica]
MGNAVDRVRAVADRVRGGWRRLSITNKIAVIGLPLAGLTAVAAVVQASAPYVAPAAPITGVPAAASPSPTASEAVYPVEATASVVHPQYESENRWALAEPLPDSIAVPAPGRERFDWLIQRGAARVGETKLQVVLTNNGAEEVIVTGIWAEVVQRGPIWAGTAFCEQTAGSADVEKIAFDLDDSNPVAREVHEDGSVGEPYFERHVISLKPGEKMPLRVSATAPEREAVTWRMVAELSSGRTTWQLPIADPNGRPFVVTGWSPEYDVVYFEGVDMGDTDGDGHLADITGRYDDIGPAEKDLGIGC